MNWSTKIVLALAAAAGGAWLTGWLLLPRPAPPAVPEAAVAPAPAQVVLPDSTALPQPRGERAPAVAPAPLPRSAPRHPPRRPSAATAGTGHVWRTAPLSPWEYRAHPGAVRADDLARRAAAGDAQASFALYRLLAYCDGLSVPGSLALAPLVEMSSPIAYPSAPGRPTSRSARCDEVAGLADAQYWLRLAADLGDTDALLHDALTHFPSAHAVRRLEELWLAGDPRAALLLARAHRDGWTDGEVFVAADPEVALAWDIIAIELVPDLAVDGLQDELRTGLLGRLRDNARGLGAASIDAARGAARTLLETNAHCCIRKGQQTAPIPTPPADP